MYLLVLPHTENYPKSKEKGKNHSSFYFPHPKKIKFQDGYFVNHLDLIGRFLIDMSKDHSNYIKEKVG